MKAFICLLLLCINLYSADSIRKRKSTTSYTASIIVPCHHSHAKHLKRLCESYSEQTCLPEEIVISLSGYKKTNQEYIDQVQNTQWPFPVRFVFSEDEKTEGQNRNLAAKSASGDILIGQDADDLPHCQRVEIIKYFFNSHDIVHLIHCMVGVDDHFPFYENFAEIQSHHRSHFGEVFQLNLPLAGGPVAIKRSIFPRVKWEEQYGIGIDTRFNTAVYAKYKKTLIISAKIYKYFWAIDSVYLNRD
jgi:hypothetical protein